MTHDRSRGPTNHNRQSLLRLVVRQGELSVMVCWALVFGHRRLRSDFGPRMTTADLSRGFLSSLGRHAVCWTVRDFFNEVLMDKKNPRKPHEATPDDLPRRPHGELEDDSTLEPNPPRTRKGGMTSPK